MKYKVTYYVKTKIKEVISLDKHSLDYVTKAYYNWVKIGVRKYNDKKSLLKALRAFEKNSFNNYQAIVISRKYSVEKL